MKRKNILCSCLCLCFELSKLSLAFIYQALFIATLLVTVFAYAYAYADQPARDNLTNLKNTDMRVISAALRESTQHLYYENYGQIIRILKDQIKRHKDSAQNTNPFILSAGFLALLDFSGPEQYDEIKNLINEMESLNLTPYGNNRVDTAFDSLKSQYQTKKVQLKSLYGESLKSELGKLGQVGVFIIDGTVELIRDRTAELKGRDEFIPIEGRQAEGNLTLQTLAELTTSIALLTGPAGSGKSSIAKLIDEMFANDLVPRTEAMKSFHGGYVIETTPARISSLAKSNDDRAQAAALEAYLDAVIEAQKMMGKKTIVFIDEVHTMSDSQVEALKRYTGGQGEIKFIFASTSEEFNLKFKQNEAFLRRVGQIPIEELSFAKIKEILYKTWIPTIQRVFFVNFDEKVVDRVIKESTKLLPHGGKIDGSIKILNKLAVRSSPEEGGSAVQITKKELSSLVREYYSLPIDPNDYAQTLIFFEDLEKEMNKIALDQERMVQDVLSVYKNLLQSKDDNVKSVYVVGPTGVGKTYFAQQLAKKVLNNSKAIYEMNGTDLMEGGMSLNSEFGAPNGVISSDKTSGEFMSWIDDQAKGGKGGIFLLNEIDKAHSDVLKKIMELLDRGFVVGGDGKKRHVKNLLVIMTSNRGMDMVFPNGGKNLSKSELTKLEETLNSDELKDMVDYSSSENDDGNDGTDGKNGKNGKMLPEIKNRIDLFTIALPFLRETAVKVSEGLIKKSVEHFKLEQEVEITVDPSLIEIIVNSSFNPLFGARPIIRETQSTFQDLVNEASREGKIAEGEKITFKHDIETNQFQILDGGIGGAIDRRFLNETGAIDETRAIDETGAIDETEAIVSQYAGPRIKTIDPLEDKDLVKTLLSLKESINSKIFGQEEMTSELALIVASHLGSPVEKTKALSIFLTGSTGTGKTEMAKVLSEILFKFKERVGTINLGNVRFEGDFNNVFNPPKGYVGGKTAGEFEKFLRLNPAGGVLLFDEPSNMGAGNLALKNAFFKLLYQITDEPKWTSSASGKTYDLTKYIFLFGANDGDKLFQGVGSDDLRKAIWEENKDKAKVIELLREAGLPEPFLGRMSGVFLMSPLTRSIVSNQIVPKFLDKTIKGLDSINVKYKFSDIFNKQLGEIFFTQGGGGRSVRDVIDGKMEGAITSVRLKLIRDEIDFDKISLHLSLEDNQEGSIYINDNNKKRIVNLKIQVKDLNGKVIQEEAYNLASDSDKTHLMNERNANITAYHEAGHAVANNPKFTNQELSFITIKGRGEYLGYARYTQVLGETSLDEQVAMYRIVKMLAGSVGQQLAGFRPDTGMGSDIDQTKKLINHLISSGVYLDLIHDIVVNKKGNLVKMSPSARAKADELFKEAWGLAVDILVQNWSAVEAIRNHLMKYGEVSGMKANEFIINSDKVLQPEAQNIKNTKNSSSKIKVKESSFSDSSVSRDSKGLSDSSVSRDLKDSSDSSVSRDSKGLSDPGGSRDLKDSSVSRDLKDSSVSRDSKGLSDPGGLSGLSCKDLL